MRKSKDGKAFTGVGGERVRVTEYSIRRALDMKEMRLSGCTYQEIATKYGISRQRVYHIISTASKERIKHYSNNYIYKGLVQWMRENDINTVNLGVIIHNSKQLTDAKLCGKSKFNINDIVAIIRESGLTFEQLFLQ